MRLAMGGIESSGWVEAICIYQAIEPYVGSMGTPLWLRQMDIVS